MSESPKGHATTPRRVIWLFITIIAACIVLSGFGYAAGYWTLPGMVRSAYQNSDCDTVLSRGAFYRRMYPASIGDKSVPSLEMECAVFTLATRYEEAGKWRDAHDAFRVYSDSHPQGSFITEAHEHGATALMNLAKEEVAQKKYPEALGDIDRLLSEYGDTAAASEGVTFIADIQMALGMNLRETGDFAGAEQILKGVHANAQENSDVEYAQSSQLELAQTYLAWAKALQEQEKFAEARAKFDVAMMTDPDPSSASGPSAQAKASQVELYVKWGDHLVAQKDFANAMKRYETAGMLLAKNDPVAAKDIVAEGYVQWAKEVIAEDDFFGALVLLDFAQANAEAAITKRLVDDTRSSLYLAFSNSEGEQAKEAKTNAIRVVCEHHTPPSLPIFGKDAENILSGIYGVEDQLPEAVMATTPASLRFAACIDEETKLFGTLTLPISTTLFGGPPGVVEITYGNYQYVWNLVVRYIDTGEEILSTVIYGEPPADLIPFNIDFNTFNYYGARPDIDELARLLEDIAR